MRRQRNRGVIYTGRVGATMKLRKRGVYQRVFWKAIRCLDGPLAGFTIRLDAAGDLKTLPLVIRGQVGRYIGAHWRPLSFSVAA